MLERLSLKEKVLSAIALLMVVFGIVTWAKKSFKGIKPAKLPAIPVASFLQENPLTAMLMPAPPPKEKIQAQRSRLKQPWGRDPFSKFDIGNEPLASEVMDLNSFVLTGIIQRGTKRVAIVNRLFVHEGDDIRGIQVVRIDQDKVVLKKNEQEAVIRMGAS